MFHPDDVERRGERTTSDLYIVPAAFHDRRLVHDAIKLSRGSGVNFMFKCGTRKRGSYYELSRHIVASIHLMRRPSRKSRSWQMQLLVEDRELLGNISVPLTCVRKPVDHAVDPESDQP